MESIEHRGGNQDNRAVAVIAGHLIKRMSLATEDVIEGGRTVGCSHIQNEEPRSRSSGARTFLVALVIDDRTAGFRLNDAARICRGPAGTIQAHSHVRVSAAEENDNGRRGVTSASRCFRPSCYSLAFSLGLFSAMKARMLSASPSSFSHCS